MIRQLGPASLFCSFSSPETQWIHLLRILCKLIDKKQYTDNEIENLNQEDKTRLIQSDPVTCARHFDYQINQFIQNFLLSSTAPLGKIADWFYRLNINKEVHLTFTCSFGQKMLLHLVQILIVMLFHSLTTSSHVKSQL